MRGKLNFNQQPFLISAPMATVSHVGFRHLIEEWGGCSLHFSEMIDAEAHLRHGLFEHWYADASPCPGRVVFQIVGADEELLVQAAASLARTDCAGIDVNMGCSAPHIFRSGAGIAWMTNPDRAARLVQRLRSAVGTKSLSMKLRLGEEEKNPEAFIALGRALQNSGADFLTLHPRVRRDSLSRPSRWDWVTVLRNALSIPVVGNGDLDSFETLSRRFETHRADGWMVGRQIVQAPWTFAYWVGRWSDPQFDLKIDLEATCHRFHELLERHQPQEFWVTRSRRFYAYFCRNLTFGHRWGARLQGYREYRPLVDEALGYFRECPDERTKGASEMEGSSQNMRKSD